MSGGLGPAVDAGVWVRLSGQEVTVLVTAGRSWAAQTSTPKHHATGHPQSSGIIAFTDDVGDMDDAAVTNATFDTAFLPGTWRLCYRQVSGVFAWEQVGPEFSVTQKLMPNGTAYSFPNPQV